MLIIVIEDITKKSEHQVVMEERRQRTDDNPLAKAYSHSW